jgi:phosphoribosylglycinamide formyltransferase-1
MKRKRAAVLISGRGSNMQALIAAARATDYPVTIAAVIANRSDAAGLGIARKDGIATAVIEHRLFPTRTEFEHELDAALRRFGVELVCLAGFMRLLTAGFVEAWRDRILNIHPSLLPAFPGLDTHARALAAGARFAGCTVHVVRAEMDAGPILAQAAVPILPDDDEGRLAARVLTVEHLLYPATLAHYATGAIRVEGERVVYDSGLAFPADSVSSPALAR